MKHQKYFVHVICVLVLLGFLSSLRPVVLLVHANSSSSWQVSQNSDNCWRRLVSSSWGIEPPALNFGGLRIGDFSSTNYDHSAGIRFQNINIPKAATITSANLSFCNNANHDGGDPTLTVEGEAADNASTFTTQANYDGRTRTGNSSSWIPSGHTANNWYNTSDISGIIQEIVNRAGWASGNSMVFFVHDAIGWGGLTALEYYYSYNNSATNAPKLYVTWSTDMISPTYSSVTVNTTLAGQPCLLSILWNDNSNVSGYFFGTNNSGVWINQTWTAFTVFYNTTSAWGNYTLTLNDTSGNVVQWEEWCNDTSNNWSSSGQYNVALTQPYKPNLEMTPDNVTCRVYLETFSVQINVTNAENLQAFNFTVHYDPSVLNYSSVTWGGLGTGTMTNIDRTNGILEGNAAGSPVNGNGWLMNITFQAIGTIIWKKGLANKLEGAIVFHRAELGFSDGSTLQYVEGGVNQIEVNTVAYVFLPIRGDVDNDGAVDIKDIRIVAAYYDSTPTDPQWPEASKYDLTLDNTIDIYDLVVISQNYGFTYP